MSDSALSSEAVAIHLAEYQALRAEILQRLGSQRYLQSLALLITAAFFGVAVMNQDPKAGALLLLGYPMLGLLLAALWGHHDRRLMQIGEYIKEQIETPLGPERLGWEHHHLGPALEGFVSWGLFIGTELFAIVVGVVLSQGRGEAGSQPGDVLGLGFLIADVLSIFITLYVTPPKRRHHGR